MITRGHLIGNVIDSWAAVKGQAEMRCRLNLTDLPIYLEDYFCTILNIVRGTALVNRNTDEANAPGIDLADPAAEEYWQVTVQNTSAKINGTLEKASQESLPKGSVYVLIIGSKQSSYSAVDAGSAETLGFRVADHVWDLSDLAKATVSLPLDRLRDLYDYVRAEESRVHVEMEVPAADGTFPTSFEDFVDEIPQPRLCGIDRLYHYLRTEGGLEAEHEALDRTRIEADLSSLAARLRRLPRITREFYAYLIDNVEDTSPSVFGNRYVVNYDAVTRNARRYDDIDGEVSILSHYKFVWPPDPGDRREPYDPDMLTLLNHGEHDTFLTELVDFMTANEVSPRYPFVHLDFSPLGDCE